MGPLISPRGVEILIRAGDLGRARKALRLHARAREPLSETSKPRHLWGADEFAQRAAMLSLLTVFPPVVIWTLYYVVRAMLAARKHRPANPRNYSLNLFGAVCFGISLATAATWVLWDTLVSFLMGMHL
jgi:hypothetical protein